MTKIVSIDEIKKYTKFLDFQFYCSLYTFQYFILNLILEFFIYIFTQVQYKKVDFVEYY